MVIHLRLCVNEHLRQRRFVQVQLQPLNDVREIPSMETNNVFGYMRRLRPENKAERVGGGKRSDYTLSVMCKH